MLYACDVLLRKDCKDKMCENQRWKGRCRGVGECKHYCWHWRHFHRRCQGCPRSRDGNWCLQRACRVGRLPQGHLRRSHQEGEENRLLGGENVCSAGTECALIAVLAGYSKRTWGWREGLGCGERSACVGH